jgi:hypothetical protein
LLSTDVAQCVEELENYHAQFTAVFRCPEQAEYGAYYNTQRPHSALHYLCPRDYYRGDPVALLAERETKLHAAAKSRRTYWEQHRG